MPIEQEISLPRATTPAIFTESESVEDWDKRPALDEQAARESPWLVRVRWGAVWVVAGRSLGMAATLLCNVLVARLLAPEDFGHFVLLSSMIAFTSGFAIFGLNSAIVRVVAESLGQGDPERASKALRTSYGIACAGTLAVGVLVLLFFNTIGAALFSLPSPAWIVPMIALGMALLTFLQLTAEALRSFHELRWASLISGGQSGGPLCNVLFLGMLSAFALVRQPSLVLTVGLSLLAMALVLPPALACLYRQAAARFATVGKSPPIARRPLELGWLLMICLPLMLTQILAFLTTQADLWIAGACCPEDQLALFGAARRLMLMVGIPLQMAGLTVVSSIPELAAQGRVAELQRLLRGTATVAAIPSTLALVAILVQPQLILGLLFGDYYGAAAMPAAILSLGQLGVCWTGTAGLTLMMTGHERTALAANVVASVALFALGAPAAWWFGIHGLAAISATVIAVQSLLLWWLTRRLVGVRTDVAISVWVEGLRWLTRSRAT